MQVLQQIPAYFVTANKSASDRRLKPMNFVNILITAPVIGIIQRRYADFTAEMFFEKLSDTPLQEGITVL